MNRRSCRDGRRQCAAWIASAAAATAATLAVMLTPPAGAATVTWNTSTGGTWGTPNWTGGVGINPPTSADIAAFNLAATYNIDLNINPNVSGVQIGGSNVTFTNSFA